MNQTATIESEIFSSFEVIFLLISVGESPSMIYPFIPTSYVLIVFHWEQWTYTDTTEHQEKKSTLRVQAFVAPEVKQEQSRQLNWSINSEEARKLRGRYNTEQPLEIRKEKEDQEERWGEKMIG